MRPSAVSFASTGSAVVAITSRFLLAGAMASAAAGPLRAQVGIGVAAPLSGPDEVFGRQVLVGTEQAVADLNAAGGLLRQKMRVVARDDMASPKKAIEVAQDLVKDKVGFVVGHFSSATTVPASTVYAEAGVLEITPSAIAPIVTDRGIKTLFRTCGREDEQAGVAARFLVAKAGSKTAIIHDRTSAGKAAADAVRKAIADSGGKSVFYGSFDKGSRDIATLITKLKQSGAQIAFFGGAPGDAGLLARALHDGAPRVTLMGGLSMASDDFSAAAGSAADGAFVVFPQDPRSRPAAADLLHRLTAKGMQPEAYVFYAYAAVQVYRQAVLSAGTFDTAKVADAIHSGLSFPTVVGDLTFDAKGDPTTSALTVYVWHKGATGRMTIDDRARS